MEALREILNIPDQELVQRSHVQVEILPDLDSLYLHFARNITNEIIDNNELGKKTVFIFPVGPIGQYPLLVDLSNTERISWKNVFIFNMDEYCDWQGRAIDPDHPLSFTGFMKQEFVNRLDPELRIPESQLKFPDPLRLDEISEKIIEVGGIDTCYGGLGYHGHVAFNEPVISRWFQVSAEDFLNSKTRLVQLAPETVVMNSIRSAGGNCDLIPPMAVTLGMMDIFGSRRIRLYCQGGSWQRTILRIALLVRDDVRYPVTLLSRHPDFKIITTEDTIRGPNIRISA